MKKCIKQALFMGLSAVVCVAQAGKFDSRVQNEEVVIGKVQYYRGHSYRLNTAKRGTLTGVELLERETSSVVRQLNKQFDNELKQAIADYYECADNTKAHDTPEVKKENSLDYVSKTDILFWNENFISLSRHQTGFCGGAHPFNETNYVTWNTVTGQKVNLFTWIKPDVEDNSENETDKSTVEVSSNELPSKLNQLIIKKALKLRALNQEKSLEDADAVLPGKDECVEIIKEGYARYQIGLTQNALIFYPQLPHAVQSCEQAVELPAGVLRPFLTKKARKWLEKDG